MIPLAFSSSVAFQRTDCTIGGILIDSVRNRSHQGQMDLVEVKKLRGAGAL